MVETVASDAPYGHRVTGSGTKVVLLSWPRTGSSSLWRILGAHPDLNLMSDEPFNENYTAWAPGNVDYLRWISPGVDAFAAVLDELLRTYDGVKILDYQLDDEQLQALAARSDIRLIYLRRRNLLQVAVSDRIAKQVRLWNRWDVPVGETLTDRYRSLRPLDIDDLRRYVEELRAHLARIDTVLAGRADPVFQVCYEDLFLGSPEDQQNILGALWTCLGLSAVERPLLSRFLDHRGARLGGPQTYGLLPQAAQINRALGSNEVGYLESFMR